MMQNFGRRVYPIWVMTAQQSFVILPYVQAVVSLGSAGDTVALLGLIVGS
jgi:hypothetical protein